MRHFITVEIPVQASLEKVWTCWTGAAHISKWNNPSADWETTRAENDLRPGGNFLFVMAAKDGSGGFDFGGVYDEVARYEKISYTLTDGRKSTILFAAMEDGVKVTEIFEPVKGLAADVQRDFCAGVLATFKTYVENTETI